MLIRTARSDDEAERMATSLSASAIYLSSVVVHELMGGARDAELHRLTKRLIEPYERRKHVVTPTHRAWKDAGRILYKLRSTGWQITPSLTNDVLIAVSATEIGATLVHDNARDYNAIQRFYPRLRHRVGWPEREAA
ncbi:MAG TPA: type II toxin-antitoxin system VapC family toxin [Longimicrobium sp.]|nr:type II toxin-antitoxin system VapC family toxin [Longimicrobium sp.]